MSIWDRILAAEQSHWLLAGALGGLVRWIALRDSWREGLPAIAVGAICALYLGPLVEPILEPIVGPIAPDHDPSGFAAFVVGLAGVGLAGLLIDIMSGRVGRGGGK